jgi:hypothetical protein
VRVGEPESLRVLTRLKAGSKTSDPVIISDVLPACRQTGNHCPASAGSGVCRKLLLSARGKNRTSDPVIISDVL